MRMTKRGFLLCVLFLGPGLVLAEDRETANRKTPAAAPETRRPPVPLAPLRPLRPLTPPGVPAAPASERWFVEIRGGVLDHDVRGLWSGTSVEEGLDNNLELISAPLRISFIPGGFHANVGGSANTHGGTSKVYAGILWEVEFQNGIFFNLGLGGATHDGELVYRPSRYLNLDQAIGRRALYVYYFMRGTMFRFTLDHNRKELGSRNLFRVPFEVGFALHENLRFSMMFDHISNGYLARPNEGLDTLGFRIGIRI